MPRVPAESHHSARSRSVPSPGREPQDYVHSEEFLRLLMSRQLRLSVVCAMAFLGMLVGLPLANYALPELMARTLPGGFTLSWFLVGLGFFPAVWLIAWFFIRRSIRLEHDEVRAVQSSRDGASAPNLSPDRS